MLVITQKEICKRIKQLHGSKIRVIGEFTGITKPLPVVCTSCQLQWSPKAEYISVCSRGCPSCNPRVTNSGPQFDTEIFKEKLYSRRLDFEVLGEYTGYSCKILLRSHVCGHVFKERATDLLCGGYKSGQCTKCRKANRGFIMAATPEKLKAFLHELKSTKPNIHYQSGFEGRSRKARFHCTECHTSFKSMCHSLITQKYGCPTCAQNKAKRSGMYQRKQLTVQGKSFSLQGYEHLALRLILSKTDLKAKDILCGKEVPYFNYINEFQRTYFPDFFIPKQMRIVEVKSNYTFFGRSEWFEIMKLKRASVTETDYKFSLLVFDGRQQPIKLPRNWWKMSYKKFMKSVSSNTL